MAEEDDVFDEISSETPFHVHGVGKDKHKNPISICNYCDKKITGGPATIRGHFTGTMVIKWHWHKSWLQNWHKSGLLNNGTVLASPLV